MGRRRRRSLTVFLPMWRLLAVLILAVAHVYGVQVRLSRGLITAGSGNGKLTAGIPDRNPHIARKIYRGSIRVVWKGQPLAARPVVDPDMPSFEFDVPAALRTPGVIDFYLWDAESQRALAYSGRVIVIIPTIAQIFEADLHTDRVVAYLAQNYDREIHGQILATGGWIDVYRLSTGLPVERIALSESQQVLAFFPNTMHAWIGDAARCLISRLNLETRETDRSIQIALGAPPCRLWDAQIDRQDTRFLIVQAGAGNRSSTMVYFDGSPLPMQGIERSLPIDRDDRGRYLFGLNACRLDSLLGFTDCEVLTRALPPGVEELYAVRQGKGVTNDGIYDLATGELLAFGYRGFAGWLPSSNRLLFQGTYDGGEIVDGDSLERWAEGIIGGYYDPATGLWGNNNTAFTMIERVWGDGWILAGVTDRISNSDEKGILVGQLPELAARPEFSIESVVNAGSGKPGAVSPGEIVSIFGRNLGAETGSGPWFKGQLDVAFEVDGVEVLFGGARGAILYTNSNQINVVAPGALSGFPQAALQVLRYGIPSPRVEVQTAAAGPGLFAYSANGRRYAAALHSESVLQGPSNPVLRGAALTLFATGLGMPAGLAANRIAARPAATPVQPTVTIGGKPAQVLYSGVSPGLTVGVAQINVMVPADAPTGEAVEVYVEAEEQDGGDTWLAIQ